MVLVAVSVTVSERAEGFHRAGSLTKPPTITQNDATLYTRPAQPAGMADVIIEYCVPCGFRERAVELQEAILTSLERDLDSCTLLMGDHGVFTVSVDGETVYDKDEDNYDTDEIVRTVREHF